MFFAFCDMHGKHLEHQIRHNFAHKFSNLRASFGLVMGFDAGSHFSEAHSNPVTQWQPAHPVRKALQHLVFKCRVKHQTLQIQEPHVPEE
jgi:hypothetical protein